MALKLNDSGAEGQDPLISASTVPEENRRIADRFIHNMNCTLEGRKDEMRNLFDMVGFYESSAEPSKTY
ncbi:MAG: hypothetical protein DCO97_10605 [Marivita sp. XM-24bin2]|nr:MAG: hypothetical protein DCO97_10605 [Marivita sp. XM-24bin2]